MSIFSLDYFAKGMKGHFGVRSNELNSFLDKQLMITTNKLQFDLLAFDDYLHRLHGDYEDEGYSMSEFISVTYGNTAKSFILSIL